MGRDVQQVAVSVLGVGAVGSRVAAALLAAGHVVTAWNRTPAKVDAVVGYGAVPAKSAVDAAAASPLVLLALTDYAAVRKVVDEIAGAIAGRTVVCLTTGSPDDARAVAQQVEDAGARYLDVGLQATLDAIGTDDATFLYGGSGAAFDEHRHTLEVIGTARHLGPDAGAAAVQDLALFGLWYDAQLGYLRALETVRAAGVDVEEFASLAATQLGHVTDAVADTAREVATRTYPRGPASLTEHAPMLDQLTELRRDLRLGTGDLATVRALLNARVTDGHGDDGLTRLLATE